MKFEEGQIIERKDIVYCVLDIVEYNSDTYILMSREKNKIGYIFFKQKHTSDGCQLLPVTDENLNNALMEIYERKNLNEN